MDQIEITKNEEAAPTSSPTVDIPSGSSSGGATYDEMVSRFIASYPGGSLMNMAKLPTEILATKGASVFAEVKFYHFSYRSLSFFLFAGSDFSPFCRVLNLLWLWRINC